MCLTMHLSDVYMFFFSRGVKVFRGIHRSRHTVRLFRLPSLCGFILLLVLITLNPSDRSGVDKSHLNWNCSKGASYSSTEVPNKAQAAAPPCEQLRPRLN